MELSALMASAVDAQWLQSDVCARCLVALQSLGFTRLEHLQTLTVLSYHYYYY